MLVKACWMRVDWTVTDDSTSDVMMAHTVTLKISQGCPKGEGLWVVRWLQEQGMKLCKSRKLSR